VTIPPVHAHRIALGEHFRTELALESGIVQTDVGFVLWPRTIDEITGVALHRILKVDLFATILPLHVLVVFDVICQGFGMAEHLLAQAALVLLGRVQMDFLLVISKRCRVPEQLVTVVAFDAHFHVNQSHVRVQIGFRLQEFLANVTLECRVLVNLEVGGYARHSFATNRTNGFRRLCWAGSGFLFDAFYFRLAVLFLSFLVFCQDFSPFVLDF
jgi:hypothetical protein